jgi:hypothetical protein
MVDPILVPIPRPLFVRLNRLAKARNQDVAAVVAETLDGALEATDRDEVTRPATETDEAVDREMAAYLAMHPALKDRYLGLYVAIHGGQLVDFDADYEALYARIDAAYPGHFVWMARVGNEPLPVLNFVGVSG